VVLEQVLQSLDLPKDFTSHFGPAHAAGGEGAFAADVYDIVLNSVRTELAIGLDFVAANWVRRRQVEPCIEEALQNLHPGIVLAMVEGEGKEPGGLENPTCFGPSSRKEALVELSCTVRGPGRVLDDLKSLGRIRKPELFRIAVGKRETEPYVKKVSKFCVLDQVTEWWVGHHEVLRLVGEHAQIGRRSLVETDWADQVVRKALRRLSRRQPSDQRAFHIQLLVADELPRAVLPIKSIKEPSYR